MNLKVEVFISGDIKIVTLLQTVCLFIYLLFTVHHAADHNQQSVMS
jgi:hypothetical protein